MSTHATLAYKKGDKYVCKDVHYGNFHDVSDYLKNATADDIIKSVDGGDSSSLFAGFYANEEYCKKHLNWSYADVGFDPNSAKPFEVTDIHDIFRRTSFVYVLVDDVVEVYEEGEIAICLRLKKGDGKGAVRNAIHVALMRDGIGAWMSDNVYQYAKFDEDELTLYVLTSNNKLLRCKIEEDVDVADFIKLTQH